MRMELAGFGVKVMCVQPGAIRSGIGLANDKSSLLKDDSFYKNVEEAVRSRGSWSQSKLYVFLLVCFFFLYLPSVRTLTLSPSSTYNLI